MIHKSAVLIGTSLFVASLDRYGKYWVREHLALGERIPLLGDWLSLAHVESAAGALGLFEGWSLAMQQFILVLVSLTCIVLALSFFRGLTPREHGSSAALGAVIAGVASNGFDRFDRSAVIDFLHWGSPDSGLADFNLADVAIVLGVVTLIVELLANEMATRAGERSSG